MRGDMTMPFGENYSHAPVRLIDFDNLNNNKYQIVNKRYQNKFIILRREIL
jgi:type I restriction enzyme R subunit